MSFNAITQVTIDGDTVVVRGQSMAPVDTVIDTRVALEFPSGKQQIGRVDSASVALVGETWIARMPVKPSDSELMCDFAIGQQVVAFGIETRCSPLRADSWAQLVTIESA